MSKRRTDDEVTRLLKERTKRTGNAGQRGQAMHIAPSRRLLILSFCETLLINIYRLTSEVFFIATT